MANIQDDFLRRATAAAAQAEHIFPEYAACEAALESGWGLSQLAVLGNNLFGQKQRYGAPPGADTMTLPTREYIKGAWVTTVAPWTKFPDWNACFHERMDLLMRLSHQYPHYKSALAARDGETFIIQVSKTWSTDPDRAGKVLSLHDYHRFSFV